MGKAYAAGVIKGYEDGSFKPDREITRAEAVAMFNRAFNRNTTEASLANVENRKAVEDFNDTANHWAYYDIIDAANERTVNSKGWVKVLK